MQNSTVTDGLRKFLRLQSLPVTESQMKWTADVSDLIESLSVLKQSFIDTASMFGRQMYQTSKYAPGEDVKRDLEEFLLYGEDERLKALYRKKNLTMYHLILEPIIDALRHVPHDQTLAIITEEVDSVTSYVLTFDDYGNEDDALVAKHQIKAMVKQREAARTEQKAAAKRGNRKKVDKVLLEEIEADPDIDDIDE